MKHMRNGFTLVEVSLFLAVSGLLILGVLAMTWNSISQQRFNDVTQSFAEFLRGVYSEVMNPQSVGSGRGEDVVYGKMITFGEKYNLTGGEISNRQEIFVYDVVGKASGSGWSGGNKDALKNWLLANKINVVVKEGSNYKPAGIVEEYTPKWEAAIDGISNGSPFNGTLLILRRPQSGTVSTFVSSKAIQVNGILKGSLPGSKEEILSSHGSDFGSGEINFCINMSGFKKASSDKRRNIRIIKDARNTSGVELINLDSDDNKCN